MAAPNKFAMMIGSLDHSPSEQLGDPSVWHTTVLVLSSGNEHSGLATEIAAGMRPPLNHLPRWSRRRERSKREFERLLWERLAAYPVHVRAISAQATVISSSEMHFLKEMLLAESVQWLTKNGKTYLRFGPFNKMYAGEDGLPMIDTQPLFFEIPSVQGIPLIFICHFLLRMHRDILARVEQTDPNIQWIDWQIMPNKFPGDINGPMGTLFNVIMSGAARAKLVAGNMRVVLLNDSKDDLGSQLADNIAGLLAEQLASGERKIDSVSFPGSFSWEIWRTQDGFSYDLRVRPRHQGRREGPTRGGVEDSGNHEQGCDRGAF